MPIQIKADEQYSNILWQIFPEIWTWEEYLVSTEKLAHTIAEHDQTMHVMVNLLNTKVPKSGTAFQYGRKGAQLFPDNTGKLVVVTDSRLIDSLVSAIRQVIRLGVLHKAYTVGTIDEGYELILNE